MAIFNSKLLVYQRVNFNQQGFFNSNKHRILPKKRIETHQTWQPVTFNGDWTTKFFTWGVPLGTLLGEVGCGSFGYSIFVWWYHLVI